MLYETAARAEEVLTLDVTDLDPEFRRAVTRSKGGDREYLHWATATARLLPHLLAGGTTGPVFLADRRSPAAGNRARALADVDPATGRGRLSYPRVEYLFKQASTRHDPHGIGWTLHQLRHSALGHLAASGRTAPELQAKSRHKHLATLGHYVRLGEETAARITAEHDTNNRRRNRRPALTLRGEAIRVVTFSSSYFAAGGMDPSGQPSSRFQSCAGIGVPRDSG